MNFKSLIKLWKGSSINDFSPLVSSCFFSINFCFIFCCIHDHIWITCASFICWRQIFALKDESSSDKTTRTWQYFPNIISEVIFSSILNHELLIIMEKICVKFLYTFAYSNSIWNQASFFRWFNWVKDCIRNQFCPL